jgi:hypothetical protein
MTMTWNIKGKIGPHTRSGADATGWLWEIQQGDEARRVLVEVSGTAQAVAERTLPDETREALRTEGESEVRKVLQLAEPPRIIQCGTIAGCRHLSSEEAAGLDN